MNKRNLAFPKNRIVQLILEQETNINGHLMKIYCFSSNPLVNSWKAEVFAFLTSFSTKKWNKTNMMLGSEFYYDLLYDSFTDDDTIYLLMQLITDTQEDYEQLKDRINIIQLRLDFLDFYKALTTAIQSRRYSKDLLYTLIDLNLINQQ